jgi:peptidoglycan/LPS O-acetylase OafA/YrhL
MPGRRGDIDGLRAIAVLSVMLFHGGIEAASGGFVGVDVFFVISGYLITLHMISDIERGAFSIPRFYARRALRILPALFLMVGVTLALGWFLLLPRQYEATGHAAIATALFYPNVHFWRETGYFSAASDFLPLLHTWSLGVEEQFYFILPVVLLALSKLPAPLLRAALIGSVVISLGLSVWASADYPSAAFYLLPTRWWELALGSLLAAGCVPILRNRMYREAIAAGGLIAILAAILLYTSQTTFPGAAALLPCLGAAAVIHAGNSGGSLVGRLLSIRPLVFVGLISYSLYLWHWPVIVFARQMTVQTHLGLAVLVTALLITFVLAAASWRFVERPAQRLGLPTARALGFSAISVGSIALCGFVVLIGGGFPNRLAAPVLLAASAADDYPPTAAACMDISVPAAIGRCRLGNESGTLDFVVWGDSYAGALLPAIEQAERPGATGVFFGGGSCPPIVGAVFSETPGPEKALCFGRNEEVLAFIREHPSVRKVYLSAAWHKYPDSLTDRRGHSASLVDELRGVLAALGESKKETVIIAGLPNPGYDVPWAVATSRLVGGTMPPSPTAPDISQLISAADSSGASVVNLADLLCQDGCLIEESGLPVYVDGGHLTATAASGLIGPYLQSRSGL